MKNYQQLINERYHVIADMGISFLEEVIKLKKDGLDYFDAVKKAHLDRAQDKKSKEEISVVEWQPKLT